MKKIVFFLAFIICFSCSNDNSVDIDCSLVNCLAPNITFKFISKTNGEDLFLNQTYPVDELKVVDQINNQDVAFNIFNSDESIIIFIRAGVPKTELKNYKFFIPNEFEFTFKFEAEPTNKNSCCPGVKINDLVIENVSYEIDNEFGTYLILL